MQFKENRKYNLQRRINRMKQKAGNIELTKHLQPPSRTRKIHL